MSTSGAGTSIERRLPAIVALLLAGALGIFTAAAYSEVRAALIGVTETRLTSASDRLAGLLADGPAQRREQLADVSARPAVIAAVRDRPSEPASLRRLLDSLATTVASSAGVVLRGRDGWSVASNDSVVEAFASVLDVEGVGPMVRVGDALAYGLSAPVVATGDTLGWLVDVRTVASNPQSARVIAGLIGADATVHVGNPGGGPWTDLVDVVEGPTAAVEPGVVSEWVRADGESMLGALSPVPGTPWAGWVALPKSRALAPLNTLLLRMLGVAALLVLAGAAGAWALGHRITGPLAMLTSAAESMAHGDYTRRIRSDRQDEVGRLGAAFDSMADQVEASRDRLEHRVAERTADLEAALADLREAQEELVRKERLAILGELAGGVGHELRNPLGVMTNAVFYLRAVLTDPSQDVDDYLGILSEQIHVSEKIVGDLLDFARVKEPQRQATPIARLVADQLSRAAVPKTVEVRTELPDNLPPASVDPEQVGQVTLNLIVNAAQALEEQGGGTLTLRGRSDNGRVALEVEDDGPGIPDDVLSKVFEPLFTTKAKGIGLGLSVSRSLAEANGGILEVRTEPGVGTTFILDLPADGGEP